MCSIKQKSGKTETTTPSKALVTDQFHFILAETHINKFGYGVVTHVGRLEVSSICVEKKLLLYGQFQNISISTAERAAIKVEIRDPRTRFAFHDNPVFDGVLVFADNIRAFSAKQRLTTVYTIYANFSFITLLFLGSKKRS